MAKYAVITFGGVAFTGVVSAFAFWPSQYSKDSDAFTTELAGLPLAECTVFGDDHAESVRLDWTNDGESRAAHFKPNGVWWANQFHPYANVWTVHHWPVSGLASSTSELVDSENWVVSTYAKLGGRESPFNVVVDPSCIDFWRQVVRPRDDIGYVPRRLPNT